MPSFSVIRPALERSGSQECIGHGSFFRGHGLLNNWALFYFIFFKIFIFSIIVDLQYSVNLYCRLYFLAEVKFLIDGTFSLQRCPSLLMWRPLTKSQLFAIHQVLSPVPMYQSVPAASKQTSCGCWGGGSSGLLETLLGTPSLSFQGFPDMGKISGSIHPKIWQLEIYSSCLTETLCSTVIPHSPQPPAPTPGKYHSTLWLYEFICLR